MDISPHQSDESSAVHESSQPIYDIAQLCSKTFEYHLRTVDYTGEKYQVIEELWGRFNQWAAYVGAFAVPRASFDARLASHNDIRDMVIELLYMIHANIKWVTVSSDVGKDSISESSPGLPAIEAAIDRLLILSMTIRRSARRIHRLKQRVGDGQNDMESMCRLLVQRRYPHARKTLCNQLAASICVRGTWLQYMQEHNRKLASRRDMQDDSKALKTCEDGQPTEVLTAPLEEAGLLNRQKAGQGPAETNPSTLLPSVVEILRRRTKKASSTIISKGSSVQDGQGGDDYYPPLPKQLGIEKYQPCPICATPLEVNSFTEQTWKYHIDRDLEPYVCISEDCIEPIQCFASEENWITHMEKRHSMNWAETIHTERWYCDLDHPGTGTEPPEFDEITGFVHHLEADHGSKLTQSRIQGRIRRNRRIATRDPFVCPLCDCIPEYIGKHPEEKPYVLLWRHIANHLKSLALLSLSYLDDDKKDSESVADPTGPSADESHRTSRSSLDKFSTSSFQDDPIHGRVYANNSRADTEEGKPESILPNPIPSAGLPKSKLGDFYPVSTEIYFPNSFPSRISDIVVGIHYGTRYSAVSWAIRTGWRTKINHISEWPIPHPEFSKVELSSILKHDRVPSVISYLDGRVKNWGYDVEPTDEAVHRVKLLLEPESKHMMNPQDEDCKNLLARVGKTAEDVVSDYLGQIWKHTRRTIDKCVDDDILEAGYNFHVVQTVPAMWSLKAMDRMLSAAKSAGLPQSIRLVAEPEAAALAVLRQTAEAPSLKEGDAFVVCDAHDGRVDVISYKVNNPNPLQIEQCAISGGGHYGSRDLSRRFEKYIIQIVGESQYKRIGGISKILMMEQFDHRIKPCFTVGSSEDFSVELRGVENNEDMGIIDGKINLTQSSLQAVFDSVCGPINDLIRTQIRQTRERNSTVVAIILLGGLGSIVYLRQRLERSYSSESIAVLQINGAWSPKSRGACLWGLEHVNRPDQGSSRGTTEHPAHAVTRRIARCSYGLTQTIPFDTSQHSSEDKSFDDVSGIAMAEKQMVWLLRKGDKISEGQVLTKRLVRSIHSTGWESKGEETFTDSLFWCDDKDPPSRLTDSVKKLCSVSYTVSKADVRGRGSHRARVGNNKIYTDLILDFEVTVGNADLEFRVKNRGKLLGIAHDEDAGPSS